MTKLRFSSRVRARIKTLEAAAKKYLKTAKNLQASEWRRVNKVKTALRRVAKRKALKSQLKAHAYLFARYRTVTWYKWLRPNGQPPIQGGKQYNLPSGRKPGNWTRFDGIPKVCERGLHATIKPLLWKRDGADLYVVQVGGLCTPLHDGNKAAFTRLRVMCKVKTNSSEYARVMVGSFTQKFK